MDNNRSANHIVYRKAVGQKCGESESVIPEERGQITRMVRVLAAVRVVMQHNVWEGPVHAGAAVRPLVNVKSKNPFMAGIPAFGEAADFSADNHALIGLEKAYRAGNIRVVLAPRNAGSRLCLAAQNGEKLRSGRTAR